MNLKHLHYFWSVARTGSVAAAAERLHITPQTISAQVKQLEDALGTALFQPAGRGLALTDSGRIALRYADEIFALSDALEAALGRRGGPAAQPFRVGISDAVAKNIAYRLLAPIAASAEPVRLICQEGKLDALLAELALHRLDMVVADQPLPTTVRVRGYNHKLGDSDTAFFAAPGVDCDAGFPACLDGAPLLLPGEDSASRVRIERWLEAQGLAPRVVGEFADAALMKAFGAAGQGIFPAPAVLAGEVAAQYGVREIGRTAAVRDAFYAITGERRITHPAVRIVTDAARAGLFGG
jgi:LysR family transcriptional activator of nhaA